MKIRILMLVALLVMFGQSNATAAYILEYTEEIFEYCVEKYGTESSSAGDCMAAQKNLKKKILKDAKRAVGRRSLAQAMYDDCVDYYPMDGVGRIGECVKTKLYLRQLKDDSGENKIYDKCDSKWRSHGYRAVHNCATGEVIFFERWHKYKED